MPGVQCARSLACKMKSTQAQSPRSHRLARHSPRRWFYGFLRSLPGDRALLPPSPRNAKHCRELTPASGCQDATTSPSASRALRPARQDVHRIPRPTCRDDRDTPLLCGARDARTDARDLPDVATQNACDRLARRANQSAPAFLDVKARSSFRDAPTGADPESIAPQS